MNDIWSISPTTAFLLNEPLSSLQGYTDADASETLDDIATNLADLLETRSIRPSLEKLPIFDLSQLQNERAIERAFQIYSYFASAYVFATGETPSQRIPASIAIPLVQLSEKAQRPPILSYATYTLANWQKINPEGEIAVENLRLLQKFIHKRDAAWFTLIHVEIEAKAAPAILAIKDLHLASQNHDIDALKLALESISQSLDAMMETLKRMPEECHPQVYYNEVRPYIFSFEGIVYEGVEKFKDKPQNFRGETGAQSSIIPALVQALGIQHRENGLTQALIEMRDYMPKTHREFLLNIDAQAFLQVLQQHKDELRAAYNQSLLTLLAFRQMHLRFAASYIANQAPVTKGTGGTEFMTWLQQLVDETKAQVL